MSRSRIPAFRLALGGALLAGLTVSGCSTTGGGPVQVTRFHLDQPIAPGAIAVETGPAIGAASAPGSPMAPDSLELSTYNNIVAGELARVGFTAAPDPAKAELIATVSVDRGSRPDMRPHGAAVSFGIGGASFGRRSGFGGDVGTTVPIGDHSERFIVGTRMMVQIKRRSEGTVIWEGRAMTEAGGQSSDASPQASVAKLAHALFTGFPGESGRTITVK
jgi:hypothetical protein